MICMQTISLIVSTTDVRIKAEVPVNPVKEGAFLAVYCQVWNSQDDYIVTMSRQLKGSIQKKMLSWDTRILADERVMLATRPLQDGSTVYFLSILDITRKDEGTYFCQVRTLAGNERVIANDTVNIDISYFPTDASPECSTTGNSLVVREGHVIEFNCSSEAGKPQVTFEWSKSTEILQRAEDVPVDESYSVLRFKPTSTDNNAIFVCTITSAAFPDKTRTCHVGPVTVIPDPSIKQALPSPTLKTEVHKSEPGIEQPTGAPSASMCKQVCSNLNSNVHYWMIATVAFSIVAIIFIITGFCLLLRYYKLSSAPTAVPVRPHINDGDDTYEKLEYRSDRKVYMALDKSWVPTHGQLELQTHYNVTPVNSSPMLPSQYHS